MTDKVQKIREEVERLKSQLLRGACSSQIAMETRCKEEAYNEVLSLLDTMQEEPVSNPIDFEKELYKAFGHVKDFTLGMRIAKWFYDMGKKSREPVSEELEAAALLHYPKMSRISEPHGVIPADNQSHYLGDANEDNRRAFKAGAKWKEKEMQSIIELAEDHAMLAGMEKMKEQMMAKAIDAELYSDGMLTPIIGVKDKEKISDIKFGDKVKLIIIKENENE